MRLRERLLMLACADTLALNTELSRMGLPATPQYRHAAHGLYEALLRSPYPPRTTTFHSFCQDILRRFPLEADIAPAFELLEASRSLEHEALDALYSEATLAPKGLQGMALDTLYDSIGANGTETALLDFLEHRSEWWAYTGDSPDPVEFAGNDSRRLLDVDPAFDPVAHFLDICRNATAEFALLLQKHDTKTNLVHAARIDEALRIENDNNKCFSLLKTAFLNQDEQPLQRKSAKTLIKALGNTGEERFLQLHEHIAGHMLETLDVLRAQQTLQRTCAWHCAGHRLIEHYQRIKDERRQLDFNDLEWKTYALLNRPDNAQWVQYKLDQRIDHVLIDEFQDTNPIQWRLLLPLLEELASGGDERTRSIFLVGDAKQSIYRFRRADARVFSAAQHWLQTRLHAETCSLDVSRRSARAIVDCVNTVFESDDIRATWAEFPHHDTHHEHLWGRVELLPLVTQDDKNTEKPVATTLRNPLLQPRIVAADQRYEREGAQIAARIAQLIAAPTIIGEGSGARPLDYGDIMILVRNRTHVQIYESALRAAGIPYTGAGRGTLLDSLEIRDLVALLKSLVTPFDNLSLAGVLRSPIFDCSDTDLMQLARSGTGPWARRLAAYAPQLMETHPLHRAQYWLHTWGKAAEHLPTHDLLDRIYHDVRLVERYQAAFPPHLHARLRANLTRFIELALELDSGRYPSLPNFLQRLRDARRGRDDAPDEGESGAAHECVRLLTIHAAKGLEAPVVFIADAANTSHARHGMQALIDWPPAAMRPECFILPGKKEHLDAFSRRALELDQLAARREELNLLYVALTRARQMLFISGCAPKRGEERGWYGTVLKGLQTKLKESCPPILESGTLPMHIPASMAAPQPMMTNIDPRLSQVLDINDDSNVIAPSRSVTAGYRSETAGDDAQVRGQVIHRLLDLMTRTSKLDNDILRQQVAAEFQYRTGEPIFDGWCEEAERVIHHPDFKSLFDPIHYQTAYNETSLMYEHDQDMVHGVIDRVVVGGKQIILIDYKTHRSALPENLLEIAELYREQMRQYAEGLRYAWPTHRVRSVLLFTACCMAVEIHSDARSVVIAPGELDLCRE